jgi:hypothetical protein
LVLKHILTFHSRMHNTTKQISFYENFGTKLDVSSVVFFVIEVFSYVTTVSHSRGHKRSISFCSSLYSSSYINSVVQISFTCNYHMELILHLKYGLSSCADGNKWSVCRARCAYLYILSSYEGHYYI